MDGWAGLGSVHRALETIRRVQWLVTPRAARTHGIRLAGARGWRSGAWPAAKQSFYFTRLLAREARAGEGDPESKVHTGADISLVFSPEKKIVASLNIPRNCDYAKVRPRRSQRNSRFVARTSISYPIEIFSGCFSRSAVFLLGKIAPIREESASLTKVKLIK